MDAPTEAGYNDRMGAAGFCDHCRLLQPAASRHCRACGARSVRRLRAAHTRARARFHPSNPVPLYLLTGLGLAVGVAVLIDPDHALSLEGGITAGCIGAAGLALVAANMVRQLQPLHTLPDAAVAAAAIARPVAGTVRLVGPPVRDFDGQPCAVVFLRITSGGGVLLRASRQAPFAVQGREGSVRVAGELWTSAAAFAPVADPDAVRADLGLPYEVAGDTVVEQLVVRDGDRVELVAAIADELAAAEYRDAVGPVARGRAGAPALVSLR